MEKEFYYERVEARTGVHQMTWIQEAGGPQLKSGSCVFTLASVFCQVNKGPKSENQQLGPLFVKLASHQNRS